MIVPTAHGLIAPLLGEIEMIQEATKKRARFRVP